LFFATYQTKTPDTFVCSSCNAEICPLQIHPKNLSAPRPSSPKEFILCEKKQLTSSPAHQLICRIASFLAIASMAVALAGCRDVLSASIADRAVARTANTRTVIDAGVVFADRESYLCLRLDQVGLAEDDTVASVASSCECVQPSVVSYRSAQGRDANAVLLRFVKDDRNDARRTKLDASNDTLITPVNLGVLIDLQLTEGSVRQFTVNFLHTSQLR
jgi:hypothetical protein